MIKTGKASSCKLRMEALGRYDPKLRGSGQSGRIDDKPERKSDGNLCQIPRSLRARGSSADSRGSTRIQKAPICHFARSLNLRAANYFDGDFEVEANVVAPEGARLF